MQQLNQKINILQNEIKDKNRFSFWSITKYLNPDDPTKAKQNLINYSLKENNDVVKWADLCEVINPENPTQAKINFLKIISNFEKEL